MSARNFQKPLRQSDIVNDETSWRPGDREAVKEWWWRGHVRMMFADYCGGAAHGLIRDGKLAGWPVTRGGGDQAGRHFADFHDARAGMSEL